MTPEGFLPPHGGYEDLLAFQKARTIYDGTAKFCERFLRRGDRTIDQMVQAARSGKQNILEGSRASGTSKETEIKLTNVARASLEELLEDYRDFLRVRLETRSAETVANILICLIHQANYLLDQLLRQLETAFLREGGLRERMTRARLDTRARKS